MTFNEKDQLEELNLLPIWELRAPSVSEPKVSNYSDDLFFVTTLNVNAKKIYFIFDVDHDDKQSQNLMNSINQFLKLLGIHEVNKDQVLLNIVQHTDGIKIILTEKGYDDPSIIKLPSLRSMCKNPELKKKLWNTIKENLKL